MTERFAGKVALVTGGGGAIGAATARRLAAGGACLVVMDRDGDAATRAADAILEAGGRAEACDGDVTVSADIAAALATARRAFGGLDILVNNAAFTVAPTFDECAPDDWDAEFAITLRAAYLCCRATLPAIAERRGAVVNVGSVNGLMYFGNPAYSAAKAGLLSLTRSLAVEYGPRGVRVNMVSPGSVRTGAPSWQRRQERDPAIFDRIARWYPLGRVGEPDDIAAAIVFLASGDAAFVTGVNLVVDGGLTAGQGVMAAELG